MNQLLQRRGVVLSIRTLILAIVGWGTFAFGAVYSWAFVPLACAAAALGLTLLIVVSRPRLSPLIGGLAAIGIAAALQLVPLSRSVHDTLSPKADALIQEYTRSYGVLSVQPTESTSSIERRPLSVDPKRTWTGLLLFSATALFLLGLTRFLTSTGAITIVRPLVVIGVLLSLVGIIQYATTHGQYRPKIYGFWQPMYVAEPFGPFVNPNHFAGWMLMVLPLALGLFYDALEQTMDEAMRLGRDRISIVNSSRFGAAVMAAVAALAMGLALAMTRSRSGLGAFAIGSLLAGWVVVRRQKGVAARLTVAVSFVVLLGGTALWAGGDTLSSKFRERGATDLASAGGRIGIWTDTLHIIRDFPLTGTGLNTYGITTYAYQTGDRTLHFQEAHNDYLQLAAEGGLLLGIPILVTMAVFAWQVSRRFREAPKTGSTYWLRVGSVIGIISVASQSMFEFSLQMPGNAVLFSVLAAVALHQSPNLRANKARG